MSLEEFFSSQTCASTIPSLSNLSSITKSKGTTTQTSLAHFKKPNTQSKNDQIKSLNSLIYNFINDNNLPMRTINKQDFWDMLMYSHNTSALFKHLVEKDLKFGQRKFEQKSTPTASPTQSWLFQVLSNVLTAFIRIILGNNKVLFQCAMIYWTANSVKFWVFQLLLLIPSQWNYFSSLLVLSLQKGKSHYCQRTKSQHNRWFSHFKTRSVLSNK